jgi:predicted aspartyl protease
MRKLACGVLILAFLSMPALAEEKCQLVRLAELPTGPQIYRVTVPAAIGDHPLTMMVDTGAYSTMLTEEKAKDLGLQVEVEPDSPLWVYGGSGLKHFVSFSGFTLGAMKAGRLQYPLIPGHGLGTGIDGVLGADFLGNFDVDFDFANAKLNLFSRDHCEGKVVYWTRDPSVFVRIPFTRNDASDIVIHVMLDGHDVKAVLDTGSPFSTLSYETAQDAFGFKDDSPLLVSVPGPNGTKNARRYPFKELSFGDMVRIDVGNPNIVLVPDSEAKMGPNAPDMIMGLSILRQLHLYIAYHEKNLYVSGASAH